MTESNASPASDTIEQFAERHHHVAAAAGISLRKFTLDLQNLTRAIESFSSKFERLAVLLEEAAREKSHLLNWLHEVDYFPPRLTAAIMKFFTVPPRCEGKTAMTHWICRLWGFKQPPRHPLDALASKLWLPCYNYLTDQLLDKRFQRRALFFFIWIVLARFERERPLYIPLFRPSRWKCKACRQTFIRNRAWSWGTHQNEECPKSIQPRRIHGPTLVRHVRPPQHQLELKGTIVETVGDAYRLIKERVQARRAAGIPKPTTWEPWWAELKVLAAAPINWQFVHDGNEDAYRDYFKDDYSPAEALEEDISYCD